MGRNKAKQIEEVASFDNVFDYPVGMKGKWRSDYFGRDGELILELGCGQGQYSLAMAEKYADKNFIGVDMKADRIWNGAKRALGSELAVGTGGSFSDDSMKNVGFIRMLIERLGECFEAGEVDEIWVTFPDPQPKPCRANKRLISPRFLDVYRSVCKPGAVINLKTDNRAFFDYAVSVVEEEGLEILELCNDVHGQEYVPEMMQILTHYEKKFMAKGVPINYLKFRLV